MTEYGMSCSCFCCWCLKAKECFLC